MPVNPLAAGQITQTYPGVFDKGGFWDRGRMSVTIDGKRVPLTPEAVRKASPGQRDRNKRSKKG